MYPVDLENNVRSCKYSSIVVPTSKDIVTHKDPPFLWDSQTTKYARLRLIFFKLIDKYPLGWYILFILAGLGYFVNSTIWLMF
jgi:hypothetical protein